jgi:hypothetical protein
MNLGSGLITLAKLEHEQKREKNVEDEKENRLSHAPSRWIIQFVFVLWLFSKWFFSI